MAEAPVSDVPAAAARMSTGERKEVLARTLEEKRAQGYQIESQTDTAAVLRMGTRRRWFGVFAGTNQTYDIVVDEHGHVSSRRRA